MFSPEQMKAARALISLTQAELAAAAGVSEISVKNIERGATDPRTSTLNALRQALEKAGVEFIPENGGGAGVRLRKFRAELDRMAQLQQLIRKGRLEPEKFIAEFQAAYHRLTAPLTVHSPAFTQADMQLTTAYCKYVEDRSLVAVGEIGNGIVRLRNALGLPT